MIRQYACRCVCVQVYERHGRRPGRGWGLWGGWMPVGLMLMDILAWWTRHNKERKVFFFSHRRWCAAAETGRGRAVYPAAQFPCYLSHCFFPPARSPAGAAIAQKGWRSVKPQNLASSQRSDTFDKLLTQHISYLSRYRHALTVFLVQSDCTEVWISWSSPAAGTERHTHHIRHSCHLFIAILTS